MLLESLDSNAKAEKAVREFTANELNTNDGMDILIGKLDYVFQSEKIDEACSTFSNFIKNKRNDDEDITDYVIECEHLYKQTIDFGLKLPNPVLPEAYFTENKYKGKQYGKSHRNNKKLNPLNKIAKVSHCFICDSKMHQVDQCPHKDDSAATLVTENETESNQENCE